MTAYIPSTIPALAREVALKHSREDTRKARRDHHEESLRFQREMAVQIARSDEACEEARRLRLRVAELEYALSERSSGQDATQARVGALEAKIRDAMAVLQRETT